MNQASDKPNSVGSPANRLGIDYRAAPPRKVAVPVVDLHTHVKDPASAQAYFEAATHYGVRTVLSMTPLEAVKPLQDAYGERLAFIAIPNWRKQESTPAFQQLWLHDLAAFREHGARLCKFWMAPSMRERYGLTLPHAFLRPVIRQALDLGYDFMVHVADPSVWWQQGGRYVDTAKFGTKHDQYPQLEWFLDHVAPRQVVGAHMGGSIEDLDWLQALLERFPNLWLDTSATKWMVREVARQPAAVRAFLIRNQDRVLFGSDLVTEEQHDFDHYASRYWAHRVMWESAYRGESPIDDPDAESPPRLAGVDLPADVLTKLYCTNAQHLGVSA